jgi:hypothetical protein
MKRTAAGSSASPSRSISQRIAELGDRRGELLARRRTLDEAALKASFAPRPR